MWRESPWWRRTTSTGSSGGPPVSRQFPYPCAAPARGDASQDVFKGDSQDRPRFCHERTATKRLPALRSFEVASPLTLPEVKVLNVAILDLLVWLGTVTFAATGALTGVRKNFDLIGVLVLGATTAIGGGAVRDVIVGVLPPTSFGNEPLLWLVALTGVSIFYLHRYFPYEGRLLYALDTLGLAIFAALGAERGLDAGLGMWGVVFAGAVSGVGGGVLRDVLSGSVPGIFYRSGDFYASAAAFGGLVLYVLQLLGAGTEAALLGSVLATAGLRVGSRILGLSLPVPRHGANDRPDQV